MLVFALVSMFGITERLVCTHTISLCSVIKAVVLDRDNSIIYGLRKHILLLGSKNSIILLKLMFSNVTDFGFLGKRCTGVKT